MFRYLLFTICIGLTAGNLASQTPWSDPASWPSGEVPQAGESVTIPVGSHIIMDVSPPPIGGLLVQGTLSFSETSIALATDYLLVEGLLQAGSETDLYDGELTITIGGPDVDQYGMGSRAFGTMNGGSLELHGRAAGKRSWTKLAAHANVGATSLTLVDAPTGWQIGDRVAIAPSGYLAEETEEVTITGINATTITFTPALEYDHWGTLQEYHGQTVDERAEVAVLSRNIVIQSSPAAIDEQIGAHGMVMPGSGPIHVEGVELRGMGQPGRPARYSFHWHLAGDRSGDYIRNCTVRDALQRGYVTHQTDSVQVLNNVAFKVRNHAFIPAEDGNEVGNRYEGNIALWVRQTFANKFAFPRNDNPSQFSTQGEQRASGFWMRNARNALIGNVTAGVERGTGFFFDKTGRARSFDSFDQSAEPIIFQDNVAHTIAVPGPNTNGGANVAMYTLIGHGHGLFVDDFAVTGADPAMRFGEFLAYKCAMTGIWSEEGNVVFDNMVFADNTSAFLTGPGRIENTLVVGVSENRIGGPNRYLRFNQERAGYYTVTQGATKVPRFQGVKFVNLDQDVSQAFRSAAFIMNFQSSAIPNHIEDITLDNSTGVLFELINEERFGQTGRMLYDADGTLSGTGEPTMLVNELSPLLRDDCTPAEEIKGYHCPADQYISLIFPRPRPGNQTPAFTLHQRTTGTPVRHSGGGTYYNRVRKEESVRLGWNPATQTIERRFRIGASPHGTAGNSYFYLTIPYPYPDATLQDQNGTLIPRVADTLTVQSVPGTTFAFDADAGELYVKFYATGVGDANGYDWVHVDAGEQEIDNGLGLGTTGDGTPTAAPEVVTKLEVFPNPVTDASVVSLTLRRSTDVSVDVLDVLGRPVRSVYSGSLRGGSHRLPLQLAELPAGVYQLVSAIGHEVTTRQLVVE